VVLTSEEEEKICCVDGPIIALLIALLIPSISTIQTKKKLHEVSVIVSLGSCKKDVCHPHILFLP
jgi:hypothetical protein